MTELKNYHVVLSIAGSDSGGGAGIQADLKTFSALGCYGASAITAVTVQNTLGVSNIHSIPPDIVAGQIDAVMSDLRPGAVKIGMVHNADLIKSISGALRHYQDIPLVLDPVMISTSGHRLIEHNTLSVLMDELFPLCTLITPNLHEAEILSGVKITDQESMKLAAEKVLKLKCGAVLIKGGHLPGERLFDVYRGTDGRELVFESEHINSQNTHGTGCSLSSAIAAYLCRDYPLESAIQYAIDYVGKAIAAGADVKAGEGHGPLNHFFAPEPLIKIKPVNE